MTHKSFPVFNRSDPSAGTRPRDPVLESIETHQYFHIRSDGTGDVPPGQVRDGDGWVVPSGFTTGLDTRAQGSVVPMVPTALLYPSHPPTDRVESPLRAPSTPYLGL